MKIQTEAILFRMNKKMRGKLATLAEKERRTLGAMVRVLIEAALDDPAKR